MAKRKPVRSRKPSRSAARARGRSSNRKPAAKAKRAKARGARRAVVVRTTTKTTTTTRRNPARARLTYDDWTWLLTHHWDVADSFVRSDGFPSPKDFEEGRGPTWARVRRIAHTIGVKLPYRNPASAAEKRAAWQRHRVERFDSLERERSCRIDAKGKEHVATTQALSEKVKRARILRPALKTSREREAAARERAQKARRERAECRSGERLQRQQARARARRAAGKPTSTRRDTERRYERAAAIQAARYHYEVTSPALVPLFDDWIRKGAHSSLSGARTAGTNERAYRDAFDQWAHDQGERELARLRQLDADDWLRDHPDPWGRTG